MTEILPKRGDKHIQETESYRILESHIPSNWLIRNVTERDYGIDCYIELVSQDNALTGEIAFVQMKSMRNISWRKSDDGYRFFKVERTTTNYLRRVKIPTYIFLADISTQELFFISVKEYIKEHYLDYGEGKNFAYDFSHKRNLFTVDAFQDSFRLNNQYHQFQNEVQYFISNLERYIDFMTEHYYRDCFLEIDKREMLFFGSMESNIIFLQEYFNTTKRLPEVEELKAKGNRIYGENYEGTVFEGVLTEMSDIFKDSVLELVGILKKMITEKETQYWIEEHLTAFNYFCNLDVDELFGKG